MDVMNKLGEALPGNLETAGIEPAGAADTPVEGTGPAEPVAPTRQQLLDNLSCLDFASADTLRDALADMGIKSPSKGLMKFLANGKQIFKCCSCVVVCDDEGQFIDHMATKNHLYGKERYATERRELLQRIKGRLSNEGSPHDFIPAGIDDNEGKLTAEEVEAWNALDTYEDISYAERATFHNLVHVGVCLVRIRNDRVKRGGTKKSRAKKDASLKNDAHGGGIPADEAIGDGAARKGKKAGSARRNRA